MSRCVQDYAVPLLADVLDGQKLPLEGCDRVIPTPGRGEEILKRSRVRPTVCEPSAVCQE